MKVKEISTVRTDGMIQFIKVKDSDDNETLVNINQISMITEKVNGDIDISTTNNERILLQGTSIVDITNLIEDVDDDDDDDDWD